MIFHPRYYMRERHRSQDVEPHITVGILHNPPSFATQPLLVFSLLFLQSSLVTATMFLLQFLTFLSTLIEAQGKSDSGCPKLAESAPLATKPKNCPDPRSVSAVKGTLRDNECLIGGIMGVCKPTPILPPSITYF